MKELLDRLENRITSLLDERNALQQENEQLRRDSADKLAPLVEENRELQETLTQERTAKEEAARRIDALLQRLTGRVTE